MLSGLVQRLPLTFTKRAAFGQVFDVVDNLGPLVLQIVGHGLAKAGIADIVGAVGLGGAIAAGDFMGALGTGLNAGQAVLYGIVDSLVITDFKMQERVVFDTAPIAPE